MPAQIELCRHRLHMRLCGITCENSRKNIFTHIRMARNVCRQTWTTFVKCDSQEDLRLNVIRNKWDRHKDIDHGLWQRINAKYKIAISYCTRNMWLTRRFLAFLPCCACPSPQVSGGRFPGTEFWDPPHSLPTGLPGQVSPVGAQQGNSFSTYSCLV